MRSRITKIGAALAALAALAAGGSTLASASSSSNTPAKALALKQQAPPQDQSGTDATAESGAEPAESGSETPGNDGPGGHADEPGNPNADTQQEGQN